MKKKILFFLFFLFIISETFAQGIDNLWFLGYDSILHVQTGRTVFDFSSGNPTISWTTFPMNLNGANGIITDSNGNLLFYSNGVYIANSQNNTMLNGSGLNPSSYTTLRNNYGLGISQGNLIIPVPGDSTKYYLFHMTIDDGNVTAYYFYYTLIDMTLDSGRGGVVTKNNVLLTDSILPGLITACKHANGRDWWVICHKTSSNRYFKFLVTPYGISGPIQQNIGKIMTNFGAGQTVFSPDGKKFAYYDFIDDLDIMNFDRCTGMFSNCIHVAINDSAACGGAAFSQNSKVLYLGSMSYVYQFDLTAANIPSTKTTVAVWDTFYSPSPPFATTFFLCQLAPDGKIYINCSNGTVDIHVINHPDSLGMGCDVCQHCVHLPTYNASTIPNHPNYFLGADTTSSVCDSLSSVGSWQSAVNKEINLFPNPVRNVLYATLNTNEKYKIVKLFNAFGQEMFLNFSFVKNGEYLEINTSSLSQGVYFLELLSEKEKVVKRFIKE